MGGQGRPQPIIIPSQSLSFQGLGLSNPILNRHLGCSQVALAKRDQLKPTKWHKKIGLTGLLDLLLVTLRYKILIPPPNLAN